jgi:hypothetical protein
MASYQSSFDPPPRPENGQRGMKLGTYIQPPSSGNRAAMSGRKGHREDDIAHSSGQMDLQQTVPRPYGRQTGLPKPRGPSMALDAVVKGKTASNFGFRRPSAPSSTTSGNQVIKNKHSRNVLRRKPSSIAQHVASPQPESQSIDLVSSASLNASLNNDRNVRMSHVSDYVLDLENRQPTLPDVENINPIIPELDRYRSFTDQKNHATNKFAVDIPHKLATHDLPPPTPLNSGMSGHSRYSGYSGNSGYSAYSGYSASPSTRYSESPGPGAYSRDTTPTSMSSQSPSVVAPLRMTPRLRQNSPVKSRPPLTRRRAGSAPNEAEATSLDVHGLPSLRESLTSSSSNSTVKESEKAGGIAKEKKKKRLSPMPPSPPPRKSSQKFKKSPYEEGDASPSKASKTPAQPVMAPPASTLPLKASTSRSTQPTPKNYPPTRPSREGTPNLEAQLGEARPIIQSNLAGFHFSQDRRQSSIAMPTAQSSNSQSDGSPGPSLSKVQSRTQPLSPVQQQPHAPSGLGIIPDLRPLANQTHQQRQIPASPTPSPSAATPKHRFGIFGRRTKTENEAVKGVQRETTTRKGPEAGTGHEGYGRYAHRGRSGSTGGGRDRSYSAASSSQESVSSTRTHDPFLLERMSPVVIAGGGEIIQYGNTSLELTRSESSQSLPITRPSLESKTSMSQTSVRSNLNKEVSRTTLWPSVMPRSAINDSSISLTSKGLYASESSDNERFLMKPSLAVRRSIHRLQSAAQEPLRLPKPLNVLDGGSSPATSSQAGSLKSDEQTVGSRKGLGIGTKKLSKRPRSPRKWNFFQRSQPTASPKPHPDAVLPVVVARAPTKPVPYYAMMDSSEQEEDAPMDIEDILREAEVADLAHLRAASPASSLNMAQSNEPEKTHESSSVIQSLSSPDRSCPPLGTSTKPATAETINPVVSHEGGTAQVPVRPSRLLQVGRIPRVVTARPQQTSPKSFSRPFARVSMIQPLPNLAVVDRQSIAVGPSPERSPSPNSRAEAGQMRRKNEPPQAEASEQQRAFLVMSPRKNSEATTSSSSGALSFAGTTAVVPEADAALEEDEVWGEYDDLIGHEEAKVPESATSSHGVPFQYESFESGAARRERGHAKEPPATDIIPIVMEKSSGGALPRLELTSSSVYSPDLGTTIKNALHGLPSPTTPMSFTDFISGYGDRNNSVIYGSGGTRRLSSPLSQRNSQPHSTHSRSGSTSERARQSADSKLITISEQNHESPIAQVNLRVGSMTVSKWLTFGHVLFSPAREEILRADDPAKHHSVLVIDGLGNGKYIVSRVSCVSKTNLNVR